MSKKAIATFFAVLAMGCGNVAVPDINPSVPHEISPTTIPLKVTAVYASNILPSGNSSTLDVTLVAVIEGGHGNNVGSVHWSFGDGTEDQVVIGGSPGVVHAYPKHGTWKIHAEVQTSAGEHSGNDFQLIL